MKFYVSCRPFRYKNELISPKESLKYNFQGIKMNFECLGWNSKVDGRWLYKIELDESYSNEEAIEIKAAIVEGLSAFGCHEKTDASAKALAEKIMSSPVEESNEVSEEQSQGLVARLLSIFGF